jgi:plastocyanin
MKVKIGEKTKMVFAWLICAAMVFCAACFDVGGSAVPDSKKDTAVSNKGTAQVPAVDDQPAEGEVRIVIENFVFVPSEITIPPGTKVTWINKDEAPHTATSVDKKFNSGGLDTDDKFSFVFNDKGEYQYFCALHPHMKATVTVK